MEHYSVPGRKEATDKAIQLVLARYESTEGGWFATLTAAEEQRLDAFLKQAQQNLDRVRANIANMDTSK